MSLPFAIRTQLEKAAVDSGFSIRLPDVEDWMIFRAHAAPAHLALTHTEHGFAVGTDHGSAAEHVKDKATQTISPDGFTAFLAADMKAVFRLGQRIWALAKSLPDEPLHEFEKALKSELGATEVENLRRERVGQEIFRKALLSYWGNACAVTGVTHKSLLRASHVVPWSKCTSDNERLNVHNGILLAAHLDAAFDVGLISFQDDGQIQISHKLEVQDCVAMGIGSGMRLLKVRPELAARLAWHRKEHGFQ
ncbi:HNH endonuclease [Cereibacter sphaeroides]|uniref:HNH endonuclease n=1 Tax=Cereibacter sphaeroides TaxID=1063 RepID=UPI001F24600F|nr:HNH endonuclease [Cereibacter sphaeroides]MCE6967199.1 HNH endonuclease [Cereibacter sphaeroides]